MPPKRARRYVSSVVMRAAPRNGPSGVPMPPRIAARREAHREVHREDVEGVDEAHVLRPERAAHGGERRAGRDGGDLEPARRHAERQRRVLVLAHGGELVAAARALEVELDQVEQHREDEDEVDPHALVRDAERPEAGAEGDGDALRAGGEAAPAAGDDEQHLRERDRRQHEVRAAQPVAEEADDEPERGRERGADQRARSTATAPSGCRGAPPSRRRARRTRRGRATPGRRSRRPRSRPPPSRPTAG